MSAVPTGAAGHHQYIPLQKLQPSPFNRKRFDKIKMDELTANVKLQGVIVPIVARPINGGDTFEIVAGERRYRAAKAAQLVDIPAIVRELSDAQALELQVIENGQREDVHPLEEAEGFERLMKCKKPDGTTYTADDIVIKIGRSRTHVYGRLKLIALCPEAREAFYAEKIDASKALLLARIPVPELQKKALAGVTQKDWQGHALSYRDAAQYVQREFMLGLEGAPFPTGDADLVKAAGACNACLKRTGNQPELFGDVKGADVCTDPPCFASKREAHVIRLAAAAKKNGQEVITGKEAKKVAPNGKHSMNGFIALDEKCWEDSKQRTYRAILGKDAPVPTLIEMPGDGKLIEAVRAKDVNQLLKIKAPPKTGTGGDGDEQWRAKARRDEQKKKLEKSIRIAIYMAAREKVATAGLDKEDVRQVADAFWSRLWHDAKKAIAPIWYPDVKGQPKLKSQEKLDSLSEHVETMNGPDLIRLLLDCAMGVELMAHGNDTKGLEQLAARHGVDHKKIRAELLAEAKENAPPKKAKAKKR